MDYVTTAIAGCFIGTPRKSSGDTRSVRASYDAARDGHNAQHWVYADGLDADSANSLPVRKVLTRRSRYECSNNGFAKGIQITQANYVIGRGPKLRMMTKSAGFNSMVEEAWKRWCKRVHLSRKLRTAVMAKVQDGEGILQAVTSRNLRDTVKLNVLGIETERMTTPYLEAFKVGQIDGIEFDEDGEPAYYHILKQHPGGPWSGVNPTPDKVPARFVFHLFRLDRFGQHRGVPETTPTLNLFANSRRYREATVAAAENIANFSILLKQPSAADDGPDVSRPFTTMPMEKGMMVALPADNEAFQPKAEQPTATYAEFTRSQLAEEARPFSMSYSIAACDSSGNSFSGTKNDHQIYYVAVDVEQEDVETIILDPLFELWFDEAVKAYGWAVSADTAPPHDWGWPAKPKIDEQKTASARATDLASGVATLDDLWIEDGYDPEDQYAKLAAGYGLTVEEVKRRLADKHLGANVKQAAPDEPDDDEDEPPPKANGRTNGYGGRMASSNGSSR